MSIYGGLIIFPPEFWHPPLEQGKFVILCTIKIRAYMHTNNPLLTDPGRALIDVTDQNPRPLSPS